MKALRILFILLLSCAGLAQSTKIRSVTSLPATCSPGDGIQPADVVALASGGTTAFEVCRVTNTWAPLLPDPGSNGILTRTAANTTGVALSADVIGLFTGCSGTQYLGADGACHTVSVPVTSVFGRTGAVVAVAGDYTFDKIGVGTNLNALLIGNGGSLAATGTGTITATAMPFSGNTASSNLNALTMGNGGSLKPVNLGQIAGNQVWAPLGISTPVQGQMSAINSGGNIGAGHVIFVQYTLNSALGEGLPSASFSPNIGTAGCTIGNCTFTMTAPTIPSGYTGWTMYFCDQSGGGGCTTPVRVNACQNISTSCSITNAALNSGVNPPTVNGAIPQPPNIQASLCPQGTQPSFFMTDTNTGNTFTQGGVIGTTNANFNDSTFTFCRRTWFNDTGLAQVFSNAFVSINHTSGVGTVQTNQDRALAYNMINPLTDVSQHYAMEGIQGEVDWQGNPGAMLASVDGEITSLSGQLNDSTQTGGSAPPYGLSGARLSVFRTNPGSGSAGTGWQRYFGVNSQVSNSATTAAASGTQMVAFNGTWTNSGTATNLQGAGVKINFPPTANKAGSLNIGFWATNGPMTVTLGSDWLIRNDIVGLPSILNGVSVQSGINNSAPSTSFPVNAALNVQSSVTVSQGTITGPSSVICSGGASTYSYEFVGFDSNGGTVASTVQNSGASCTNPLTSGNPATVNVTNSNTTIAQYAGFVRIDVYRTAGPMATGKIGSLTCVAAANTLGPTCNTFSDTGLAATTAVPTVNTTGGLQAAGYLGTGTNTVRVGPSGFTTAANTNLQTITGLSWSLDSGAKNYSFHCALSYSQATANAAVAFGIQAATNAPTNIFANGAEQITVGPPATEVNGTLATLSTTTATAIVSGTPGATATSYVAMLDGSIEEPANTNGNVINIMVSTATSGDAVTVLRGSYCYLY